MVENLFKERGLLSTQSLRNLLNHNLFLNSKVIQSYLSFSKDIDAICNFKSTGESTSDYFVAQECEDLLFDPDTD